MKKKESKRNKKKEEEEEDCYLFSINEVTLLRNQLQLWYLNNRRLLPWRGDIVNEVIPPIVNAYGIMVSEIMLQQTRVEAVISYWLKWMNTFPTIESLANSTIEEVNSLWAGLGYYRRAKNLHECSKIIVSKYQGIIPKELNLLLDLPGIGPYTAGAISSIAYNIPTHAVDGNVVRVISRLRAIDTLEGNNLEKKCRDLAQDIVDQITPSTFNQALMELGATICKPQNPICESNNNNADSNNNNNNNNLECPLMNICKAYQKTKLKSNIHNNNKNDENNENIQDIEDLIPNQITSVTQYPKKVSKKPPIDLKFIIISLHYTDTSSSLSSSLSSLSSIDMIQYLFSRRPATGLLANQWEFPSIEIPVETITPLEEHWIKAQNKIITLFYPNLTLSDIKIINKYTNPFIHIFTHQKHHMFLLELSVSMKYSPLENFEWMNYHELTQKGMTTGVKKVFSIVKKNRLNSKEETDNTNHHQEKKKRPLKSPSSIQNSTRKKKSKVIINETNQNDIKSNIDVDNYNFDNI